MADHGFDLDELTRRLNGHSMFAPSSSAMWIYCAGSLIPNLLAEDKAGEDAAYGTVGHAVGERWLQTGIRPTDLIGTVEEVDEGHEVFRITIDEDMLDHVEKYIDWCASLPGHKYVEQRVFFSQLTPVDKQSGTADHIAIHGRTITVTDLKMGKGVQVFAKENTQAILYALGCFFRWDWEYGFERIVVRICQPRLNHYDVWEISREELLRWADFIRERAALAWQPNAPRTAGEKQCTWCKVKANCATYAAWMVNLTEGVFDNLEDAVSDEDILVVKDRLDDEFDEFSINLVNLQTLSPAQIAMLLKIRRSVENWFKSMEDHAEKLLKIGKHVPGRKLVQGRSNRIMVGGLKSADTLELYTGIPSSAFIDTEIKSPAQVEVVLKNHGIKGKQLEAIMSKPDLVRKPPGRPVMAPEHDKREALSIGDEGVFDNLEDDL